MRALGMATSVLVFLMGASACGGGGSTADLEPSPAQAAPSGEVIDLETEMSALEQTYDVRLGVYAIDTGSGDSVEHRADERFAFASTSKALLVGVLLEQQGSAVVDQDVPISAADIVPNSPRVEEALAQGRTTLTVAELADAAVRFSDNAAANLLFGLIGGPGAFEEALRATGDEITMSDRTEPDLNEAVPGDERDTSTPQQLAEDLRYFTLGDAAPADRELLLDLMRRNTTGDAVIRAGVPEGWEVADKTGSASYGTRNDIAVVWPPGRDPIVVAILTSRDEQDADTVDAAIADAMAAVAVALDGDEG